MESPNVKPLKQCPYCTYSSSSHLKRHLNAKHNKERKANLNPVSSHQPCSNQDSSPLEDIKKNLTSLTKQITMLDIRTIRLCANECRYADSAAYLKRIEEQNTELIKLHKANASLSTQVLDLSTQSLQSTSKLKDLQLEHMRVIARLESKIDNQFFGPPAPTSSSLNQSLPTTISTSSLRPSATRKLKKRVHRGIKKVKKRKS